MPHPGTIPIRCLSIRILTNKSDTIESFWFTYNESPAHDPIAAISRRYDAKTSMTDRQQITNNMVITMQYSLANTKGIVIREAASPPVRYLHGSGTLFPKLEQALESHRAGDIITVKLLPDDAFGKRKTELLCQVPLEDFPPEEQTSVGGSVVGKAEDGEEVRFMVADIRDGVAHLDGNHPLAGQSLVFEIEVQAVRKATAEEISAGRIID
jgi:FKBP-type peptidyl-prolyl cis-trans isomerase SlyD